MKVAVVCPLECPDKPWCVTLSPALTFCCCVCVSPPHRRPLVLCVCVPHLALPAFPVIEELPSNVADHI